MFKVQGKSKGGEVPKVRRRHGSAFRSPIYWGDKIQTGGLMGIRVTLKEKKNSGARRSRLLRD